MSGMCASDITLGTYHTVEDTGDYNDEIWRRDLTNKFIQYHDTGVNQLLTTANMCLDKLEEHNFWGAQSWTCTSQNHSRAEIVNTLSLGKERLLANLYILLL